MDRSIALASTPLPVTFGLVFGGTETSAASSVDWTPPMIFYKAGFQKNSADRGMSSHW
jgi:hypothetical protein